jgi:hypothetical protein
MIDDRKEKTKNFDSELYMMKKLTIELAREFN